MSSESNYSFTTKVNGDLFTVRGDTLDEFHTNVAAVTANATAVFTDLGLLQAAGHGTALVAPHTAAPTPPAPAPAAPSYPPQQPQQQWGPPPQQQWNQPSGHTCDCGQEMRLRNGKNGAFYSCAKRMDDPTRCRKTVNV